MIGIKLEDKDKILDYCLGECVEKYNDLHSIYSNIIIKKSEEVYSGSDYIDFSGMLYYPNDDNSNIILSDYKLQIRNQTMLFNLRYILLNKLKKEWVNGEIKNISKRYTIDDMAKNIGYLKYNDLITIS